MKKWIALLGLLVGSAAFAQDTIQITCSEDYYLADAQFSLTIDGKVVTAATSCPAKNLAPGVPTGASAAFTFTGNWGGTAAKHVIVASFLNDAYAGTPATDRNLFVWNICFDGVTVPYTSTTGTMTNGIAYLLGPSSATYTSVAGASRVTVSLDNGASQFSFDPVKLPLYSAPLAQCATVACTSSVGAGTGTAVNVTLSLPNGTVTLNCTGAAVTGSTGSLVCK